MNAILLEHAFDCTRSQFQLLHQEMIAQKLVFRIAPDQTTYCCLFDIILSSIFFEIFNLTTSNGVCMSTPCDIHDTAVKS